MKDLTRGSEARLVFFFTLPLLFGNVFQQLYNTVDSIVVGKYVGKEALAAVGQAFPVLFLSVALVMGFGMSSNVLIAQAFGARRYDRVKAAIDTSFIVTFAFSLVVAVLGYAFAPAILALMRTPGDVVSGATLYLRIIFAGIPAMFGYNAISAIQRGLGDSKTPLYALIVSTVLNIILDLLFVIAFGWGIAGVAVATIISQGASFVWTFSYLVRRNPYIRANPLKMRFDREVFFSIMKMGLPSGIQQALIAAGFMTLTGIVNLFGTDPAAAFTAASKLESFAVMPAMNFSLAIASFTGQNLGAGRVDRVRRGLLAGVGMAFSLTFCVALTLYFFGGRLITLFSSDAEVLRIGAEYLKIVSLAYLMQTVMFSVSGVIRGAGRMTFTMVMALLSMWIIRIPLAFLLSSRFGTRGIWYAIDIGFLVGMTGSLVYYFAGTWKSAASDPLAASVPAGASPSAESISV